MDKVRLLPDANRKFELETNSDSIADRLREVKNKTEKEQILNDLYS